MNYDVKATRWKKMSPKCFLHFTCHLKNKYTPEKAPECRLTATTSDEQTLAPWLEHVNASAKEKGSLDDRRHD